MFFTKTEALMGRWVLFTWCSILVARWADYVEARELIKHLLAYAELIGTVGCCTILVVVFARSFIHEVD